MSRVRARSPWTGPLGLYRPGTTAVHRAPVAAKLTALTLFGLAVVLLRGPGSSLVLLGVAVAAAVAARVPARATLRGLAPVLVTAAGLVAYQWWQRGPAVAIEVGADLVTLVVAAGVVTATTPADRMLDALERAARPLARVGLRPEIFALSVALMLRTIPALVETGLEVRDAARARGLERNPRALLVPAAVRTVARARATGEGLAARGLGE
ncbi:energy-coupling factor transporter transmembrane component T family protein [Pengzhenrongella sicca]|uniref:Energy-coupling factor transporter transmembrane protein EcfT n=1 Tax=Pengzhenrongella sicca TaxID=2819238 RepID=A0A8A4ZFF4_9MICO|nr:energy-coupling factor transporter transmembrane protein EcfT [Pengzhenrongella sicca]QTE30732.1 energy-coupling factor transporter transmembrane protein EcfT [Pengzhenrongella sicca]